jgi:hypothetical protein
MRRTSTQHIIVFPASLVLLVAAAACGGAGDRSGGAVVRDSAGIQIVENSAPQWSEDEGWQLAEEPTLEIGALEGDAAYQFYRVANARRLSNGRIVVANSGTHELRFFDSKGKFLSSAGREGGGPGEFQGLFGLWGLSNDSLYTFDYRQRRVSVFDAKGNFIRSFDLNALTGARSFPTVVAPFADGSLLISARQTFFSPQMRGGLRRDSVVYLHSDPEGELIDSVGWHPGPEWYVKSQEQGMMAASLPFGRAPDAATFADAFYFGSSDSYEIARYGASGAVNRLIRKAHTNPPVTPADISLWKEEQLEDSEDESQRQFWQRMYADMPFPETMPAYEGVIVDEEGNLWVEEYRAPGDEQPRWTVFDSTGVMLGLIETPPRFRIFQIGSDFVLGRQTDSLDVERVQLYRLRKG